MVTFSGKRMSLKDEFVKACTICGGEGWLEGTACKCLLKFRVYNRMLNSGFSRKSIENVDRETYKIPVIEQGAEFVSFFLENPSFVENKGLGLFIYSQDKGRGKTTLAHKLVFEAATKFVVKESYSSTRMYAFQHVEDLLKSFRDGQDASWTSTWYVLDDLGNEDRNTEWKRGLFLSSFQRVLHYRRDRCLPTIITSNYRPEDLSIIYGGELDSLLEIHPDGKLGGVLYRGVQVGGAEDLRLMEGVSAWPL